jgi:prophage antirepressor-like protein
VCDVLEIVQVGGMLRGLDEDEKRSVPTSSTEGRRNGGKPDVLISESGLYAAVLRSLAAALAHTLHAAATELDNGRALPVEVRRAARHVLQAIGDVEAGRG